MLMCIELCLSISVSAQTGGVKDDVAGTGDDTVLRELYIKLSWTMDLERGGGC